MNHVALVVSRVEAPDEVVAVGRFVRDADQREAAEIAITVDDSLQGRGLGKLLARELGDTARALGIKQFTATMLTDNVELVVPLAA